MNVAAVLASRRYESGFWFWFWFCIGSWFNFFFFLSHFIYSFVLFFVMKITITCNTNKLTKQEKVERIVAEERVTEKKASANSSLRKTVRSFYFLLFACIMIDHLLYLTHTLFLLHFLYTSLPRIHHQFAQLCFFQLFYRQPTLRNGTR